jgi:Zn-dependent protease with chaperone function
MDFYSRQTAARKHTRYLVIAFIVAVLAIAAALDLVLFATFSLSSAEAHTLSPLRFAADHPGVALFCTLLVIAVIGFSSLFKSLQLREGGSVVARSLGGTRIARDTTDFKRKRLHNIVEEMSIASGVPMPEIYVLEQERGINAFAAGHTPANAAVAVTQGALDTLSRDELQSVIAHEFSHVLNGDMRLNLQLMGWLFGLLVVALIGRTLLRYAPRGRRVAGGVLAAGVAVMVLGYIGMFFARIIQAAVARQRERLADASSVQFTRNPGGLRGALLKIAGLAEGSIIREADGEQAAHMFFAPGVARLLHTHPPLAERIKEIDPQFNPKQLATLAAEALQNVPAFSSAEMARVDSAGSAVAGSANAANPSDLVRDPAKLATFVTAAAGIAGTHGAGYSAAASSVASATAAASAAAIEGSAAAAAGASSAASVSSNAVAGKVGQLETMHIAQARELRLALPETLRDFVESTGRARALVLALLLSRDDAVRERQFVLLGKTTSEEDLVIVRDTLPVAASLEPMLRLPALLQIFPALRRLPISDRQKLAKLADDLIRADARVDVFEFCLAHLLATLLRDELEARTPHGNVTLDQAEAEIQVLFATLARFGASDANQARMAYEAGMQVVLPMRRPPYLEIEDWPQRLADALRKLEKLQLFAKKAVIEGLAKTVAHDDVLNVSEAELLRTVCAALHCPLPPLLPGLIQSRSAVVQAARA